MNIKFPNTTNMPHFVAVSLQSQDDFNHDNTRANFYSNVFQNLVESVTFNNAGALNPTYRQESAKLEMSNDIDKEKLYNMQKRFMLGNETINMSDILPAFGALNGASKETYENLGESKEQFMTGANGRHMTPIIFEMDKSHGKYGVDRKQAMTANTEISFDLKFKAPLTKACVLWVTSGYVGKYAMKKTSGTWTISYKNVEISSNQL